MPRPARRLTSSGARSQRALLGVPLVGGRVDLLGDDHFAGHRLVVQAAAEADHEQRPARSRSASPAAARAVRGPCPSCGRARRAPPRRSARPRSAAAPPAAARSRRRRRARPSAAAAGRRRGTGPSRRGLDAEPAQAASAAASCPLSTALSSVAGQPVAVQVPASSRPGTAVRARGRSAPHAGRGAERGGVLARDQEALDARARGRAAAARAAPAGSARAAPRRSSASPARRPTATRPDTGSPAGAPAAPLRSNRYCTGVPTPAANGWSQHDAVVDDVEVHDRRGAQSAQPRRARPEQRLEQRRRARVRHRDDHRLARARRSPPRPCTSKPAPRRARAARRRQPSRTLDARLAAAPLAPGRR